MKKHFLISLLSCLFLALSLFSQGTLAKEVATVEMGQEQKIKNNFVSSGIIMENDNNFYVLERKLPGFFSKTKYFISIYDRVKMSKVKSVELVLPKKKIGKKKKDTKVNFEGIQVIGHKMVLVTSIYDYFLKATFVYLQKIDSDGKLDKEMIELDKVENLVTKGLFKFSYKGAYSLITSNDNSKFLISKVSKQSQRDAKAKFKQKIFDADMNIIWSGEVQLPSESSYMYLFDCRINNDGKIYYLSKEWKEITVTKSNGKTKVKKVKGSQTAPAYFFKVYLFDYKTESYTGYLIDLGKNITDMQFSADASDDYIICAGFYSNQAYRLKAKFMFGYGLYITPMDLIAGSFFVKIDKKTGVAVSKITKEFDKDFLAKFKTKKGKNGIELEDFDMKHMVFLTDGSVLMVTEKDFVNRYYFRFAYGGVQITIDLQYFHEDDLVIVKYDDKGNFAWNTKVDKKQVTLNDGGYYSSYILNYSNDKLHLIYADHKKNLALPKGADLKTMRNPKKSVSTLLTVDKNGNQTKTKLFSAKDAKVVLAPEANTSGFVGKNSNEVYVYGVTFSALSNFFPFISSKMKYGRIKFTQL
jgi:hypothetical protein